MHIIRIKQVILKRNITNKSFGKFFLIDKDHDDSSSTVVESKYNSLF